MENTPMFDKYFDLMSMMYVERYKSSIDGQIFQLKYTKDELEKNGRDPDSYPPMSFTHGKIYPVKDTNPKDAVGIRKVPMSTISAPVLMEVGLGMMEGARKYGRHNYRVAGARASVYYDASLRHLFAWWEGQDIDPDSGLSHISKCIATLVVMRDAMINDQLVDDRPPKSKEGWMESLNQAASALIDKYPLAKEAITELSEKD